jgi:hypothetical protein
MPKREIRMLRAQQHPGQGGHIGKAAKKGVPGLQRGTKAKPPRPTCSIFRRNCHLPAMYSADKRLRPVTSGSTCRMLRRSLALSACASKIGPHSALVAFCDRAQILTLSDPGTTELLVSHPIFWRESWRTRVELRSSTVIPIVRPAVFQNGCLLEHLVHCHRAWPQPQ